MKSISIQLPDFSSMTDKDMQQCILTGALDGRWSALTHWLLESFQTDQLELNAGWAMTWQGWQCPACVRDKHQIARLTERGVLLCRLEEHHDHLSDLAALIFRKAVPEGLSADEARSRRLAFSPAYPLIERFARTLICIDCNAADAAMKAAIGSEIPRYFSFSPSEIRRFVIAAPHKSHDINIEKGEAEWASAKKQFEERVAFAEMMADRVMRGLHDRERSNLYGQARMDDARLLYRLAFEQLPPRERPRSLEDGLLARSRSVAVRSGGPKARQTAKVQIPTGADFAALDAAKQISAPWRNAGEGWTCAACGRSKFQIMRASKKGVWTAHIFLLNEFDEEHGAESRRRRSYRNAGSLILGSHRSISVCQDCRQIVTDAVTLVADVDQNCLRISDISSLIEKAEPHRRHLVEPACILEVTEGNDQWIAAVEDYWMHRTEAGDVDFAHYRIVRNQNLSYDDARRQVIPALVAAGKMPAFDAEGWFDWLMSEYREHHSED